MGNSNQPWKKLTGSLKEKAAELKDKTTGKIKDVDPGTLIAAISTSEVASKLTSFYSEQADIVLGKASSVYDKALDASFLKSDEDGMYHRLFDGGHDIFSAWDRVKDASNTDNFTEEVIGYSSALVKDVVTQMGLPLKSMGKEDFEAVVDKLSVVPGIDRAYLYDLFSTNAAELTALSLSSVGAFFAFKNEDYEKFSEILGSMGIASVISANPVMGLATIAAAGYSYKKEKMSLDKSLTGAGMSSLSFTLFSVLGLPFIIEIIVVMIISSQVKKNLFRGEEVSQYLVEKIKAADFRALSKRDKAKCLLKPEKIV